MTASHDEEWNYPMIEGCPATLEVTPEGVTLTFERKKLPYSIATTTTPPPDITSGGGVP